VDIPVESLPSGRFILMRMELAWTDPLDPEDSGSTKESWRALLQTDSGWEKLPIQRVFQGLCRTGTELRSGGSSIRGSWDDRSPPGSDWASLKRSEIRREVSQAIDDEVKRLQRLVTDRQEGAPTLEERIERLEDASDAWSSSEGSDPRIEMEREVLLSGELVKVEDDRDG